MKAGTDNPSVNIIATERYVSGYACKGSEYTGAHVNVFNDLANVSGATAKPLCTKLLMHTIKRDISAVEASFELSCMPLFRCSHPFQSVSMSGSRVLEKKMVLHSPRVLHQINILQDLEETRHLGMNL